MRAKEQKIKEAWIAEIGEDKYNDIKHLIDKEGYLDNSDTIAYLKMGDFKEDYTIDFYDNYIFRPKSLKNISNNNGWNRVEDGLPEEEGMYITAFMNHEEPFQLENYFSLEENRFFSKEGKVFPTHWRKKEIYTLPIY